MANVRITFNKVLSLSFFFCGSQLTAQGMEGSFAINYGSVLINSPQNLVREIDPSPDTIYNKSAPTAAPQSLTFSPSAAQRKKNLADYISGVAKVSPDYAPQLAAELDDGQVFNQYGQMLDGIGLNASDVGDNLAVWWITAWEAAQGRPVEINPATFARVKHQVQRVLAADSFAKMSDSDKQKFSDSLMIQTLILANQIDQAKSDSEIAKQLAAGIKKGASQLGFDLENMKLTPDGFVAAKGRKTGAASDAVKAANPTAAPTAVAAKDGQGAPAKDAAPTYMLLAAIGGASLGGVFLLGKAMGKKG